MSVTLIIEDGSGIVSANSYVSIADATTYFNNVGNTVWPNLDPSDQQGQYLIQAWRFMLQSYRTRWKGYRTFTTQLGDWPRFNVEQQDVAAGYGPLPFFYDPHIIPQEIKDAQCELAVRVANGDLNADIGRVTTMEKVGSIQVNYAPDQAINTVFTAVELLLKPFFKSNGIMSKVSRA